MTKTFIRHANGADFSVLLNIDQSSFTAGVAYDSFELSYFMNRPGAETIVLEQDGTIAAFLIMGISHKRKSATIVTLDVRQEDRRLGYGSRLMARSEEILVGYGVERYDLQVDTENIGAIAFYERHGFRRERILTSYYANGNDAFLMIKRLREIADTSP